MRCNGCGAVGDVRALHSPDPVCSGWRRLSAVCCVSSAHRLLADAGACLRLLCIRLCIRPLCLCLCAVKYFALILNACCVVLCCAVLCCGISEIRLKCDVG